MVYSFYKRGWVGRWATKTTCMATKTTKIWLRGKSKSDNGLIARDYCACYCTLCAGHVIFLTVWQISDRKLASPSELQEAQSYRICQQWCCRPTVLRWFLSAASPLIIFYPKSIWRYISYCDFVSRYGLATSCCISICEETCIMFPIPYSETLKQLHTSSVLPENTSTIFCLWLDESVAGHTILGSRAPIPTYTTIRFAVSHWCDSLLPL